MPASLLRRLGATAYESLLLGAIVLFLGFALLPVLTPRPMPGGLAALSIPSAERRALSLVAIVLACGAYCVWLWSGGRRTLPMKTWRLSLEGADGSAVAPARAILRYAAWWIGPALALGAAGALPSVVDPAWALPLLGVNYAWAFIDPGRLFLHDRIAGTRLMTQRVRSPRRTPDDTPR